VRERGMIAGMARLYLFVFAVDFVLTVVALISVLSAEDHQVRTLPRIVWVIVILLFPLVGPFIYFRAGRPVAGLGVSSGAGAGDGTVGGAAGSLGVPGARASGPASRRIVAPDDDPDFLREIERRTNAAESDRLRQWELELRRREDELRKRENPN
jgi:hypothetical protein